MKKRRMAAMSAALVLALAVTPTVAYAGGGDESGADAWIEPAPSPEPGEPFTKEGNLVTRDLLYDEATNKQFITVQTKGGSTFYVVIDYDKPADEAGEQYEAYFLNLVDEADLLALLDGDEAPVACDCIGKCAPGAVNTACPLCAVNMTECAGKPPEPVESEPTPSRRPRAAAWAPFCWWWPWCWWAAEPDGTSKATALSIRPRWMTRMWRTTTTRPPGTRTSRRPERGTGSELHRQPL